MGALKKVAQKAPAAGQVEGVAALKRLIEAKARDIRAILGDDKKFEQFRSNVVALYAGNGELQKCDPVSVMGAAMTAVRLGLSIEPTLGQAWVLPRWDRKKGAFQAVFQTGYRGELMLQYRSDLYEVIEAFVVYDKESFRFRVGRQGIELEHQPLPPSRRGEPVGVYGMWVFKTGHVHHHFMWWEEIMERAKLSPSWGKASSPWTTHPEAMAKKTVLLDGSKTLPMDTEHVRLQVLEGAIETGKAVDFSKAIEGGNPEIVEEEPEGPVLAAPAPAHDPATGEVTEEAPADPKPEAAPEAAEAPAPEPIKIPAIGSREDLFLYLEDIGVEWRIAEAGGRTFVELTDAPEAPEVMRHLLAAGFGKKGSRILRDVTELPEKAEASLF